MIAGFDKRGLSSNFFRALQHRFPLASQGTPSAEQTRSIRQASEKLVDRFENGIRYHISREVGFRKSGLSFASFRDLSNHLRELGLL